MEVLENLQSLEGKTIKHVRLVDCDEKLLITFKDETCALFSSACVGYGGETEICFEGQMEISWIEIYAGGGLTK